MRKEPIILFTISAVCYLFTVWASHGGSEIANNLINVFWLVFCLILIYLGALSPRSKVTLKVATDPVLVVALSVLSLGVLFLFIATVVNRSDTSSSLGRTSFVLAGVFTYTAGLVFWFGNPFYSRFIAPARAKHLLEKIAWFYFVGQHINSVDGLIPRATRCLYIVRDIASGEYNIVQLKAVHQISGRVNGFTLRVIKSTQLSYRKPGDEFLTSDSLLKRVPPKYAYALLTYLAA